MIFENADLYNPEKIKKLLKTEAQHLGFDACGVAQARRLDEEEPRLEAWLKQGLHGKMQWMENHFDKRLDPTLLVPGAKTVVSLLYNYYPSQKPKDPLAPKVAKYAWGEDYHFVIKRKLKDLMAFLQTHVGDVQGRAFVDSAPVLEHAWARLSGLGWVGKHSLLLNKTQGSFFFLCELIIDIELPPDGPVTDHCGTCTRCIDACPTDAIIAPKVLDASKCISYLTIELKDEIPNEFEGQMENWAFGCDICQDVCPWNRFAKPHKEPAFEPHPELLEMTEREWHEMTDEVFGRVFKKSAVKRTKFSGLKRNLKFIHRK